MDDWRSPRARLKKALKGPLYQVATGLGLLTEQPQAELETVQREAVPFYGNRPGSSGGMALHEERRLDFRQPRPVFETVPDIFYSATGMVWQKGSLIKKYSVLPVKVQDLFRRPPGHGCREIERCAIVQSDFVYSYGDWVHCFLGVILSADFPDVPVLLPGYLARKSYVRRDLAEAGIDFIVADDWVRIAEAVILRKRNPFFYWTPQNVEDFRRHFPPSPEMPAPGSTLYLGRFDLKGETTERPFPSQKVADYVTSAGGKVVRQEELSTLSARQYAPFAETVIGDHGSGMLNIMFWHPTTVIELVVDRWWVNNTLFVAAGMGVKNFAVIEVDGLSSAEIGERIRQCQAFFRTQDAAGGQERPSTSA